MDIRDNPSIRNSRAATDFAHTNSVRDKGSLDSDEVFVGELEITFGHPGSDNLSFTGLPYLHYAKIVRCN